MGDSRLRDVDRFLLIAHGKDRNALFGTVHFQLFDSRRAVNVRRHEERPLALGLVFACQLGSRRRFARALKASHHDDRHAALPDRDLRGLGAHELDELVIDDLDDHLAGVQSIHDVLTDGSLLHRFGEVLDHLEVDVGLEEGHLDLLHGLADILLGQATLCAELFEYICQFFGKTFKCH